MTVYILSGKLFGKNIYEIDYTLNIDERLSSDILGYPDKNKILFKKEFLFLEDVHFIKNILPKNFSEFKMKSDGNFYKIELEKAINMIHTIIDIYDKPIKIKAKPNRSCFSI